MIGRTRNHEPSVWPRGPSFRTERSRWAEVDSLLLDATPNECNGCQFATRRWAEDVTTMKLRVIQSLITLFGVQVKVTRSCISIPGTFLTVFVYRQRMKAKKNNLKSTKSRAFSQLQKWRDTLLRHPNRTTWIRRRRFEIRVANAAATSSFQHSNRTTWILHLDEATGDSESVRCTS